LFLTARGQIQRVASVVFSVLASQVFAFALLLLAMNIYRLVIHRIAREWI